MGSRIIIMRLQDEDEYYELLKQLLWDYKMTMSIMKYGDNYYEITRCRWVLWIIATIIMSFQDENEYYELLKQLLKEGYDVDTIKKELSKNKKEVGKLNLEEMNVDNNILYRLSKNNYGEILDRL